MKTPTINPDEMLKSMAAEAVKQHKQIRTTIRDLTLEALQMRELSLKQINSVVRKVTEGVNVGVGAGKIDVEKALSNALAGMDEALLKVVEANKVALQKLTEGGASFEESSVKKGLKELFFKRLELLESLFHARFLEARATFGQFLQRDLVGFDDLEQGLIHPRERVREGFFHIDLACSNANVNAFSDLAHHAIDLLQAQFAHLQRLKREVANGGAYLLVLLYRLGGHRLEHLVRIDRWGFHLISPASS